MTSTASTTPTVSEALLRARAALRITAYSPGTRPADARQQAMQAQRAVAILTGGAR